MPKLTFRGGVHPLHSEHEGKLPTRNKPVRDFAPEQVSILMGMHLGAPSKPCVQKGDHVKMGQLIGEPVGGLGVAVHASVSGEVVAVEPINYMTAAPQMCVTIKNDFKDEWVELKPLGDVETCDPTQVVPAIKAAGICGMGGAAFPTHVKLTIREGAYCDTIILNGAECETYLTADYRLMLEDSTRIVDGLRAVMRALDVKKGVIAIEDNKPEAIEAMEKAAQGRAGVQVVTLKTKYPQGGEKQLIQAVTGREVPVKKLPLDAHVIVLNVGTAHAIADAVIEGKPLVQRITTVTGCVVNPDNLRTRVGTPLQEAINACGGYKEEPGKIICGGGMTGNCAPNDTIPTTKATNGIVVYNEKEAKSVEEGPCIRCGRCVESCPMGLNPYQIKHFCDMDRLDEAQKLDVMDCVVCGSCSYICPAQRSLTASFKVAKEKIAAAAKRGKA
ncbi:MAG TPA: electron transport complex subunit RsxC [Candidatus Excrementavichristensenella intestinipullorum]|nr:electron transport complex subunit RsxC [Candidatus Excrementavichristensenella intestinipullorum]